MGIGLPSYKKPMGKQQRTPVARSLPATDAPGSIANPKDMSSPAPTPRGGLLGLVGTGGGDSQGGEPSSSLGSRLGYKSGYDDDFRSRINKLGATLMMLDPMSRDAGATLMQLQQNRAQTNMSAEHQNATAAWLRDKGVGEQEASYLASDPEAMRAWHKDWTDKKNPKWEIKEINNEKGQKVQAMIDMNTGNFKMIGGAPAPKMSFQSIFKDGKEQKALINEEDPSAEPILIGDQKGPDPDKAPTIESFYDKKTGMEYKAAWNPQTKQWDMQGGQKAPTGETSFTVNPDGTVTYTQGGKGGGGKLTEKEQNTVSFLTRMDEAEGDINKYQDASTSLWGNALDLTPDIVRKQAQSPEYKMGRRAGRLWLQGVLRGDSGAAITDDEWDSYGDVFTPTVGDGEKEIEQKARLRAAVKRGMKAGLNDAARLKVLDAVAKTAVPGADDGADTGDGGDAGAKKTATGYTPQPAEPGDNEGLTGTYEDPVTGVKTPIIVRDGKWVAR